MEWTKLKNQEIKNIFYEDEYGGIGISEQQFHLIEQGHIYFELTDCSFYEILCESENGGISITKVDSYFKQKLQNNKIDNDKNWSGISNKKNLKIHYFKDYYLEFFENQEQRKEVISTIEIVFINGETIFISNAGYVKEGMIQALTDDFIIYKKRKVGLALKLKLKLS